MADIKAEEILKRSKERSKVFDELINSPTHNNKENVAVVGGGAPVLSVVAKNKPASDTPPQEPDAQTNKKTGSGKVRNLCSRFENIIANELIDSRPASPQNRSIVSTSMAGDSAHRSTRPLLSASADRSIGSMGQRPTVPLKTGRAPAPPAGTDNADNGSLIATPVAVGHRQLAAFGGNCSMLLPPSSGVDDTTTVPADDDDLSTLIDRSIASAAGSVKRMPTKPIRAPVPPPVGTDSAGLPSPLSSISDDSSDAMAAEEMEKKVDGDSKKSEEVVGRVNESTTALADSRPITLEDFLLVKPVDRPHRPITPNSEVLGSLLDDIYHDMEKFQRMGGATGGAVARNEADAGGELQHTISFYRRRQTQSRCSSHHEIDSLPRRPSSFLDSGIATQSLNSSNASSEPTPTNEATLKRLQEALIVQQDHIHQASRALAYCRQQDHFRGSAEEIDAQRALLVATEKRRAYLAERDRVIAAAQHAAAGVEMDAAEPRGTLAFSYIAVRLSRDFINMYIQQHSESRVHYFIVLIKHGEHVFHTSMVSSTTTSMKSGYIEFPQYISVAGLTSDFAVMLEVYDLPSPTSRPTEKKRKTARKMVPASLGGSSGSTGSGASMLSRSVGSGKQAPVLETAFRKVGHMTLNRSHLHASKRFLLSEVLYPLDGVVMLNLQCLSEHTAIVHRGFLSLYQLVSGLGSWTRFWCVLGDGVMSFWRYPEDEERHRNPVVTLELRKCLSDVSEVTNSAASFPHSMQVDVASAPSNDAPTEEIRMLFAADTHEEMMSWTETINKAIQHAKIWT